MAPRRKPPAPGTQKQQSPNRSQSNGQRRAVRRPRRNSVRSSISPPATQENLPRNVKRIVAGTAPIPPSSRTRFKFSTDAAASRTSARNKLCSSDESSPESEPKHEAQQLMDIEPNSTVPLTKEELELEEGIRSLECSQDVPEEKTARDATSCSDTGESSSEDSDEELAKFEQMRTTRRSARTSNPVQRFDPSDAPKASVFGTEQLRSRGRADVVRNPELYLAKLVREQSARERKEDELQQMRDDLQKPTQVHKDEEMFATMAKAEQEAEERRLAALDKYSAPIPLFCKPFTIPQMPAKYLVKGGSNRDENQPYKTLHTAHDMLVDIVEAGEQGDRALSVLVPILKEKRYYPVVRLHHVVFRMVYIHAVYDRTLPKPGRRSRDALVDALIHMVENELDTFIRVKIKLPTLMNTLFKYGAAMPDWLKPKVVGNVSLEVECLDSQIPTAEEPQPPDNFKIALRNLRRACKLAAAFIKLGLPIERAIGVKSVPLGQQVLLSIGLVTRLLLSAFGNRLYVEVGEIITEVLKRIPEAIWPAYRLRLAKYMLSITPRLELHVELVANLIPFTSERTRYLALDYSFLSYSQWCRGPGSNPQPRSVDDFQPSERAKTVGIKVRSYCLADVVDLLRQMPEIDKETDCIWAWLISYQLRLILSEPGVYKKRDSGELSALNQLVQKLRTCTNRMAFDVPVQDMRIELDTLVKTFRAFGCASRDGMAEILPNLRAEKKQETLVSMFAEKTS
ncbi:hypothetical protein BWQ96_08533 [Gracilariopsis chorda]|uniref:Uncharacterized protein n=1 Tax=Gracilariopsis chorda TaxID=448386 RepID=A0A2V3II26_9FLOR|nr:hypothetical protein BWQ96_08533 [Gracilariopsis chorda]|eukprot:PXF41744.1 hypothetical protein BWQ96_08533 [Gracilariopsis chorda]